MQCGVSPAGRYSARNVGGQLPSNASSSPVSVTKPLNRELPRSMLKSPHATAGTAGAVHHCGEPGELGAVQRVEPARPRPVTVPVGHRMRVEDAELRACQPGHQNTLQRCPPSCRPGDARRPGRETEPAVDSAGNRQPREGHQPPGRASRRSPPAYVPERAHPPGQQPQMPPGEHLLETGDIRIPRLKRRTDHRIPASQVRPDHRDTPRVQRHDSQPRRQAFGHARPYPARARTLRDSRTAKRRLISLAGHQAGQDQRRRRTPGRDRVQADDQAEALDWRAMPITVGRMQTRGQPRQ